MGRRVDHPLRYIIDWVNVAFVIVDEQFFSIFYILDGKNSKQSDGFDIVRVVLIRKILQQVSRQIFHINVHLCEANIWLVARWGMIDHVTNSVRIVVGGVN